MTPTELQQAWAWGGWPAVAIVAALALAKWYCSKKLEQDRETSEKKLKQDRIIFEATMQAARAGHEMMGAVADTMLALVYRTINNEEAARVMAELAEKRLEAARASERVASQKQWEKS